MTPSPKDEPAAAIEYYDGLCSECSWRLGAHPPRPDWNPPLRRVRVVNIEQVKAGWLARGELPNSWCRWCRVAYLELAHYIPIECAGFPCPGCGPGAELTTEILSITQTDAGYDFVVLLKCDKCSKQHRLAKLLAGLAKITKVKVGPTGVEVEVKP